MNELDLFAAAIAIDDPRERDALLSRECAGRPELRLRLDRLLQENFRLDARTDRLVSDPSRDLFATEPEDRDSTVQHDQTENVAPDRTYSDPSLDQPKPGITDQGDQDEDERPGTVIAGKYMLADVIGEGGMGSVYRASQTQPVKRQVALKLIKTGMNSRDVLARFDAERQALALMDHPNIARIYDGGVTDSGQPYFVMELVDGVPITDFCDLKRLTVNARLELFVAVCQAVQHAHQKGIIHRDLKPSNVLVTEVEGHPTPKVIDFGVAKATEQKLTDMSFSDTGAIVGTPAYMSPEQADPASMDIDTRTDVYALGVMLYELLVGSPPLDAKQFKRGAIVEMLRMVREVDPPRPSTKLSTAGTLPNIAANRSIEPAKLSKLLKGELDWVVMKSQEKDRNRRYETANGLARDLQRYLADEVVEARPPSRGYRFRKFVRRHKGQVIAASLVLLSLFAGVVGTTLGMVKAKEQQNMAELNLKRSEENFRLAVENQKKSEENYRLAREAVDRYLTQVSENRLLNEPYMDELRLELLGSAKEFYQTFADRRREDRTAAKDLAIAHANIADIDWRLGKNEAAIEELEISRKTLLAADPAASTDLQFLRSGVRLSSFHLQLGRFDQALSTVNRTLSDAETAQKAQPDDTLLENMIARVLELRGTIFRRGNRKAEAIADFERAAKILERLVLVRPDVYEYSRDLAKIFEHRGYLANESQDIDEADDWHRKSMAIHRTNVQADPTSLESREGLAVSISNVALVLRSKEKYVEAIQATQEIVDIYRTLVREHPGVARYRSSLASVLTNLAVIFKTSGAFEKADLANRESIGLLLDLTRQFPSLTQYAYALGAAEGNEGNNGMDARKWDEAIAWFDRSNATLEPLLKKSNDPRIRQVLRNNHWGRADSLLAIKKFAEAIVAYDSAITMADQRNLPEIRMARAMALAKSGDHQAARAAVDAETANAKVRNFVWFDASKVLVAAATAASHDPKTVVDLQARAVAALRLAFESKYFGNAKSRAVLRSPDFAPLQEREDFQKLLADVDSQAKVEETRPMSQPTQEKK